MLERNRQRTERRIAVWKVKTEQHKLRLRLLSMELEKMQKERQKEINHEAFVRSLLEKLPGGDPDGLLMLRYQLAI